jgi:hypothetical protein
MEFNSRRKPLYSPRGDQAVGSARSLVILQHRMWIDQTEFNWSKKEVAA